MAICSERRPFRNLTWKLEKSSVAEFWSLQFDPELDVFEFLYVGQVLQGVGLQVVVVDKVVEVACVQIFNLSPCCMFKLVE